MNNNHVSGAISSGFSSAAGALNVGNVAMIGVGGLSGGVGAWATGGNFWDGMRQGLITAGLNHAANHAAEGLFTDPPFEEGERRVLYNAKGKAIAIEVDGKIYKLEGYERKSIDALNTQFENDMSLLSPFEFTVGGIISGGAAGGGWGPWGVFGGGVLGGLSAYNGCKYLQSTTTSAYAKEYANTLSSIDLTNNPTITPKQFIQISFKSFRP